MNKTERVERMPPGVASYEYFDLPANRIHHWMPSNRWAIGLGPIRTITEKEALAAMRDAPAAPRAITPPDPPDGGPA